MIAIDTWRQQQRVELHFTVGGIARRNDGKRKTRARLHQCRRRRGALLKLWEFPSSIVDPVCWQYEPGQSREEPLLSCLLHVAKWLRDASHLPDDVPLPPAPEAWILETLRIAPESLETRLYRVRDAFLEASKLLE